MKPTVISTLGFATAALAHGLLSNLTIDDECYELYDPYKTPYMQPVPEMVGWTVGSNGPVQDVSSAAIACNAGSKPGALSATAAAGASLKFSWTEWPESHRGPVMTYLANCHGDCRAADPTKLDFFKIDDAGMLADGTWISDSIIRDGSTYTTRIPSDIAPGNYLLRHELLALHSASSVNEAQFYPVCVNLKITGTGTAVPTDTVKFPGGYKSDDPGILINIYYPKPTSYVVPGPPVYSGGGAAPASSSSTTAYPTEEPATTIAAYPTSEPARPPHGSYSTSYFPSTLPWPVTINTSLLETLVPYLTEEPTTTVAVSIPIGGTGAAHAAPSPTTTTPPIASYSSIGTDGAMTSTLVSTVVEKVTTTLVQTVKFTLTVHPASTATEYENVLAATVYKTVTASPAAVRPKTVTATVTATVTRKGSSKIPACTPAGRYRRYWN